jgi:hypothetical protein
MRRRCSAGTVSEARAENSANTTDAMTDPRSPLDAALDVFVFIPLGIAATAADELPRLAARGRAEVSGRLTVARMVGQFAVAQGRKEVERRLGLLGRPVASSNGATRPRPAGSAGTHYGLRRDDGAGVVGDRWPQDPDDPVAAGPAAVVGSPPVEVSPEEAVPDAAGLAIPGYDSLSASQVVQRLAGLSRDELAAVGEYESSHRARRTVLTRVSQLQGS